MAVGLGVFREIGMRNDDTELGGTPRVFPPTRWSLLRDAQDRASPTCRSSIEALARTYWRPIYGYLRRKWDKPNEEAKDLAQDFFLALCENDLLDDLSPEKGRFRSYVMGALDNFVRQRRRYEGRLKRGGGVAHFSFDTDDAFHPSATETPEASFDREWGEATLRDALAELERECRSRGQETAYRIFLLRDVEPPPEGAPTYEALADRFGVRPGDVTNFLYRLRQRFRDLVLDRIRDTVGDVEEAEAEARDLFRGWGS